VRIGLARQSSCNCIRLRDCCSACTSSFRCSLDLQTFSMLGLLCFVMLCCGSCCVVQAVKTVLNYLSETNGELHYFLHDYVSIGTGSRSSQVPHD
jgi:hypothetical protein